MAKRVNNIAYKGINHSPSLVSDTDGHASECANLSPDFNDLKPMPMPVKVEGYTVTPGARLIFVHLGVGYKNYVELDDDGIRLYLRDEEGNYLYYADPNSEWWLNESEVLSVEAIGDTLIVSTKGGTEYLVYRPDDELYKWLGQKPPMPVIEFGMRSGDNDAYTDLQIGIHVDGDESIVVEEIDGNWWYKKSYEPTIQEFVNGMIAKLNTEMTADNKFNQPFLVRYAYRMKTGDYTMQSPPVLMLPSTKKCPYISRAVVQFIAGRNVILGFFSATKCARLQYRISTRPNLDDWKDIISGVDVFITTPIYNYDTECSTDAPIKTEGVILPARQLPFGTDMDFGQIYANGDIEGMYEYLPTSIPEYLFTEDPAVFYKIKSVDGNIFDSNVRNATLFHKVASIDIDSLYTNGAYKDLPIESLASLANMPTLPDDYNSHCAVSASLMQVYNSRLNMANISQKVFDGFGNAYHPQSDDRHYHGVVTYWSQGHVPIYGDIDVKRIMFNVRKNGKVYTVSPNNPSDNPGERLDYTSYIYYPDEDCFEAVVYCSISYSGLTYWLYYTIPMARHETLNGSYWYDGTNCLGEYIANKYRIGDHGSSVSPVTVDTQTWYDIPNRFMMSSVGNPWHFPVGNQFDIGRREIRALSINAESMDAPQFGQNPIYVFSADGIWTIDINADGTFRKLNYVSGDVLSEMDGIGGSPTASAQQATFFKTERGIMVIVRSQVKDISLAMKGRIFNPIMRLLPMHSVKDGIPNEGSLSRWRDLIDGVCDNIPFADFAASCSLLYDYRNDRLLCIPGNKSIKYMYVYDVQRDFWSKMMMLPHSDNEGEESQGDRGTSVQQDVAFTCSAMDGSMALLQDAEGNLWQVGGQPDENDINTRQFGFYVSRPMRFGTDDYKTLTRVVHDQQLSIADEKVRMALYGSRDGRNYYQITTLKGTSYKFFVIVLYTHILPSSRYAYTAFEWEARMTDKIR